ncbi:MAG: alpha-amylase family glycosyl hydrolase [Pseudomonadota bacterium]
MRNESVLTMVPPNAPENRTEDREFGKEWWRGAAIYQIYPRSFRDSDGDGIGDLRGITEKLDYVADLGVDGVWISPFYRSPMNDFGYDVSDYCSIDPVFGTLQDFDALIGKAHGLGLKVIIDQVYCHTSDQHAWFRESRQNTDNQSADWYVWASPKADGTPPSNWLSVFGGPAWSWDGRRQQYYLHHFLSSQPTLNLHNDEVIAALISAGEFWIDRGVDGFRLDALNMGMHDPSLRDNPAHPDSGTKLKTFEMQQHIRGMNQPEMTKVVARFAEAFRRAGGDSFFTVAEIGGAEPLSRMVAYTEGRSLLSSAYSFDFIGAMHADAGAISASLTAWPNDLDRGYPGWALSNHDCHRVASRWSLPRSPQGRNVRLFALLHAAIRGVTFIYQGEELGLPQADIPFDKLVDPEGIANWPADQGRDGARTPFPWTGNDPYAGFSTHEPWLPIDPAHLPLNAHDQCSNEESIHHFFREALGMRRNNPALRLGDFKDLSDGKPLIAFERSLSGKTLICCINLQAEAQTWAHPVGASRILISAGLNGQTGMPTELPAHSGFIAERV